MPVKTQEDWLNRKWRPMMAVMYFVVCICDFIIFPILWSILQASYPGGSVTTAWTPITLHGGGLFHAALGMILGVSAWTRGQEKIAMFNLKNEQYKYNSEGYNRYKPDVGNLRRPPQYDDRIL